jgi:hypothetical protein
VEVQMKNWLRNSFKNLSSLQRRTLGRIFVNLILMGAISAASHFILEGGHRTRFLVALFAALPAIPMLVIILLLGRYLASETDEFIRTMVVKSLLWGAAVTVAGDMAQSALVALSADFWSLDPGILTVMNFDLFFFGTAISLAIQLRRYR